MKDKETQTTEEQFVFFPSTLWASVELPSSVIVQGLGEIPWAKHWVSRQEALLVFFIKLPNCIFPL